MNTTKPNFPVFLKVVLLLPFFVFVGCLDSEYRIDQKIRDALVQVEEGEPTQAITALEKLQDRHPNNARVAEALGTAYEKRENFLIAANYFHKAANLSPNKQSFTLRSARNLIAAGRKQDAISRLDQYLDSFPEDGVVWLVVGKLKAELGDNAGAVDALTHGLLLTNPETHTSEDNEILGALYLEQSDYPQADFYLNQALVLAETSDEKVNALVGLVSSSINQKDWDVAQIFLKQIETEHPAALSSESVKTLKNQVDGEFEKRLKAKKAAEEAKNKKVVVKKEAESKNESAQPEKEQPVKKEEKKPPAKDDPQPQKPVNENSNNSSVKPPEETPKKPVPVVEKKSEPVKEQKKDPATEPEVKQEPVTPPVETVEEEKPENQEQTNPDDSALADPDLNEPYVAPENEAELLILHAKQLIEEGDYPKAIRAAWDSINRNAESPAAWFMLSYGYSRYGQYLNAESAALEAVRLNPNNKKIVLQYLRVLQKSRSALRFHEELLNAYQRFNKDPDFILALARSYARIKNDPENSAALYRRFMDVETDQARVAKIREEVTLVE